MSFTYSAEVVVGMRLPSSRLWKESRHVPSQCHHKHTNQIGAKFCSECGLRLTTKTVNTPWPGQSHTTTGKLFGFPIVWIRYGESDGVILCAAQLARVSMDEIVSIDEMIEKLTDVDVEHLKRGMIEKLEPHGLWDSSEFGTWLVNSSCW